MNRLFRLSCGLFLIFCMACLVSSPAWAEGSQSAAQALAAKVQKRYETVQSLKADYTRTSRMVAGGGQSARLVEASGRLVWQRPMGLRMEQDEPRQELVVTTAQGVWWARPQRKRADLYPLEQFTTGLQSLLDILGGLARVEQNFKLEKPDQEEIAAAKGPLLVLSPRERRVDLKRLVVWFDAGELLLKGFRLVSLMGDVTEYRLSKVEVNPDLAQDTFAYKVPPGFKARDHRPRK
jgi:outer membrane lipoprotein-sorting protein